jgi:sugar lactone lactonase YvrE
MLGVLALGTLSDISSGIGAQSVQSKGTVYVTKGDNASAAGAILKPLDLSLGILTPIVTDLQVPDSLTCGSDGRLYVNDVSLRGVQAPGTNRLWRVNQDGSGRTIIADWPSNILRPNGLVFAPNGDLYFGTFTPLKGIWRIPGALQTNTQFNLPQEVLPASVFGAVDQAEPHAFLTTGPFAGDLLIAAGGKVLRATKPNFDRVVEFIPRQAAALAVNSKGDILITDFSNDRIHRYGSDGTRKGIFATMTKPNQIAIGPDDTVYVTNPAFRGVGAIGGSLFVFTPEGKLVVSTPPLGLQGVAVCAQQ